VSDRFSLNGLGPFETLQAKQDGGGDEHDTIA
jgi:hypothetical protein